MERNKEGEKVMKNLIYLLFVLAFNLPITSNAENLSNCEAEVEEMNKYWFGLHAWSFDRRSTAMGGVLESAIMSSCESTQLKALYC